VGVKKPTETGSLGNSDLPEKQKKRNVKPRRKRLGPRGLIGFVGGGGEKWRRKKTNTDKGNIWKKKLKTTTTHCGTSQKEALEGGRDRKKRKKKTGGKKRVVGGKQDFSPTKLGRENKHGKKKKEKKFLTTGKEATKMVPKRGGGVHQGNFGEGTN